jgi:hypothetical protein
MKKFEKLSRAEMKNVLGGVSLPTCGDNTCGTGQPGSLPVCATGTCTSVDCTLEGKTYSMNVCK